MKKSNITDKTTVVDLRKILTKEWYDINLKSMQDEINKQSRKEYNFLKSAMSSKHNKKG